MSDVNTLCARINERFADWIEHASVALDEVTIQMKPANLLALARALHDEPEFDFNMLIDVCGIDYLQYGFDDWETHEATEGGFSRGVTGVQQVDLKKPNRFAVVYHLLSLNHNCRLRIHVNIPDQSELMVDSVVSVWPSANWFEREAFDLYGVMFHGHPDLRRLLTDYGFAGHPFRKDFPLVGKVEARYDASLKRVVYEPVSIQPRTLEPKVIRHDNRYAEETE